MQKPFQHPVYLWELSWTSLFHEQNTCGDATSVFGSRNQLQLGWTETSELMPNKHEFISWVVVLHVFSYASKLGLLQTSQEQSFQNPVSIEKKKLPALAADSWLIWDAFVVRTDIYWFVLHVKVCSWSPYHRSYGWVHYSSEWHAFSGEH